MKTFSNIALLALAFATSVHAADKSDADTTFLTKVTPGIATSIVIIEYAEKNASDEKVKDFAKRVAKQHKGSLKTANDHAKRLKVEIATDPNKDSKKMIDKLSKLKGVDLDIAFLVWFSHVNEDRSVFENEVKNGTDADLKAFAKSSIKSGIDHSFEASALLRKLKE